MLSRTVDSLNIGDILSSASTHAPSAKAQYARVSKQFAHFCNSTYDERTGMVDRSLLTDDNVAKFLYVAFEDKGYVKHVKKTYLAGLNDQISKYGGIKNICKETSEWPKTTQVLKVSYILLLLLLFPNFLYVCVAMRH